MSALKTTADEPALRGQPIAHDQARVLLGQVSGLVAVTVGFTALGAHLGRDLSGGDGLVLLIGAFACIVSPTRARAVRRPARVRTAFEQANHGQRNFGAGSTR